MKNSYKQGAVIEIRILDLPRNAKASGYFNDWNKLEQEVKKFDGKGNIYHTINPVNTALLSRAANRIIERPRATTSDMDISERRWLLIDCDPQRPSGIMATNEEKQAAFATGKRILEHLQGQEWPDPVVIDSGNGLHLRYRIDLPNDKESEVLIENCLKVLALRFDDQVVKVDTGVFNASRIARFPGTMNVKGDNTPDRPHRRSKIVKTPVMIDVLSKAQLQALAALMPKPQTEPRRGMSNEFDLEKWITDYNVPVAYSTPWNGKGHRWVLSECPWNAGHTNKSAYIIRFSSGAIAAGCHHNSCQGNEWHDMRDEYEPGWREKRQEKEQLWQKSREIISDKAAMLGGRHLSVINMKDIQAQDVTFLWRPYLPIGKLVIMEGNPGEGKTFAALAMASSITRGTPFIESAEIWEMREPANVLYLSAEDGAADTIRPRLDRLSADVSKVYVVTGTQQGTDSQGVFTFEDLPLLEDTMQQIRPKLVVVDPIQAYLGASVDMHRANEVRPILAKLAVLAERYECVMLCIRHLSKGNASKALFRGMGSIDFSAAARSVLLVGADSQDESRKAMVHLKSSLAAAGNPVGYELSGDGFTWTGVSSVTALDILGQESNEEKGALDDATEWLEEYLSDGPKMKALIDKEAERKQIKQRTLRRAKEKLKIRAFRPEGGKNPPWSWELPGSVMSSIIDSGGEVQGVVF